MYRIVFNFRSDGGYKLDEKILAICISKLWNDVSTYGVSSINRIRDLIFPMGQLNAGLFINLDDSLASNGSKCLEKFKANLEDALMENMELVVIAENYIRFKFTTEGIVSS